jgi:hypothetical protein
MNIIYLMFSLFMILLISFNIDAICASMLVPDPFTAADVPDLLPTIAVTDDVAAVELAMKVAAVANLPFAVVFVAGATTEPFDAASATDVPSATG